MTRLEAQNQIIEMQRSLLTGETLPGIDKEGVCVYQGSDNEKCSIGVVLFGTDSYNPEFEGSDIKTLLGLCLEELPEVLNVAGPIFCNKLQRKHDDIITRYDASEFRRRYYDSLKDFCLYERLTFPFTPDTLEN